MRRYSEYLGGYTYFNVMRSNFSIIAFLVFTISCGHSTSQLSDAITASNLIYKTVTDKNIFYLIRYIISYYGIAFKWHKSKYHLVCCNGYQSI